MALPNYGSTYTGGGGAGKHQARHQVRHERRQERRQAQHQKHGKVHTYTMPPSADPTTNYRTPPASPPAQAQPYAPHNYGGDYPGYTGNTPSYTRPAPRGATTNYAGQPVGTNTSQGQQYNYSQPVAHNPGFAGPYAGPSNDASHPFFDPQANYTQPGHPYSQFPEGSYPYNYYATNESPEGWYYAWLGKQGLGGMDAKSQAAQGMYRDFATAYQAAKATGNIELWWPEFMNQQNIGGILEGMSNDQLGIDSGRWDERGPRYALRGI